MPDIYVNKFGRNIDADTGDDVWDAGGAYPFPSAAAATTVESSSVADTLLGTGARTVEIQGLDANYEFISETAELDGTTPVTLANEYLRVYRAKVLTAGTGENNAGNIDIKHGATVLARISANYGQTLMAIYTTRAGHYGWINRWRAVADGNSAAKIAIQTRNAGGAWQTKDVAILTTSSSTFDVEYQFFKKVPEKTDLRVRVLEGANNLDIVSQLDIKESTEGEVFGR